MKRTKVILFFFIVLSTFLVLLNIFQYIVIKQNDSNTYITENVLKIANKIMNAHEYDLEEYNIEILDEGNRYMVYYHLKAKNVRGGGVWIYITKKPYLKFETIIRFP